MSLTGSIPLQSKRLLLRPLVLEDAPQMYQNWASDAEVCQFLTWAPHGSVEDTKEVLAQWIANYESPIYYQWGIEYNKQLIGTIGVWQSQRSWEMGYCIGAKWWGQGIMTEAVTTMFDYLFFEQNFRRVFSMYAGTNPASGKVMQHCAMTKEGVLRQQFGLLDGTFTDFILYGILQPEWEAFRRKV